MSEYDPADFVDDDFQAHRGPHSTVAGGSDPQRAPSREEVDTRVAATQQRLTELKRAQEELERERASLEETRRRQMEFQTGRQELIHNLTRGVGLLEEAEFNARRDAEQMAKTLADFREALAKVGAIHEESWTKDNFNVELTRALTAIENGRMEWNSARLKFPILSGQNVERTGAEPPGKPPERASLGDRGFLELCKIGLALTWPVALTVLLVLAVLLMLWLPR